MIPLAISSQRVIPPKMLNSIAVTFSSEVITSSASTIASAFEPPPASRKLAGLAARLGDDVERRHAEPGAVAEDADVALELHVGEALLLRHLLLGVLVGGIVRARASSSCRNSALLSIVTFESSATTSRVGGDDQRIDLDQGRVLGVEHLVQLRQHLARVVDHVLVDPGVDRRARRRASASKPVAGLDVALDQRRRDPSPRPPRRSSRPSPRASPAASSPSGRG